MPLCDTPRETARDAARAAGRTRRPARALVGLLAGLTAAGASLALAGPAAAESQVTITDDAGASVTEVVAGSVVHVAGTGFQSVQGGSGGIYVTFGWVDDAAGGTWRPTAGGATGTDYLYAPDVEGAENKGFQRYVAFPGSATAAAANGGVIAEDGTWATDLTIPAEQFEALDRAGNPAPVDCAQVQCGFITVGAHGVKNANNETFTPVTFVAAAAQSPAEPDATDPTTDAATDPATDAATDAAEEPASSEDVVAVPISAPVEPAEDDSTQRTFILSLVGGLLTIGALIAVGIVRAKRRNAADAAAQAAQLDQAEPDQTQPGQTQPGTPSSGTTAEAGAEPRVGDAGEGDQRS